MMAKNLGGSLCAYGYDGLIVKMEGGWSLFLSFSLYPRSDSLSFDRKHKNPKKKKKKTQLK